MRDCQAFKTRNELRHCYGVWGRERLQAGTEGASWRDWLIEPVKLSGCWTLHLGTSGEFFGCRRSQRSALSVGTDGARPDN